MMSAVSINILVVIFAFVSLWPDSATKALHRQPYSSGKSSASIIFSDGPSSRPYPPAGNKKHAAGIIRFGETSAIQRQQIDGLDQKNEGHASGLAVLEQTGLGGNSQAAHTSAVVESQQESDSSGLGFGGTSQSSNNQANVNVNQNQQNVVGTAVNIGANHTGVVVVNTEHGQALLNNRPLGAASGDRPRCRYTCLRPSKQVYCCDDGSDKQKNRQKFEIHGGYCPPVRDVCLHNQFVVKCAHDGHCFGDERCCYDECARHHICKPADADPL